MDTEQTLLPHRSTNHHHHPDHSRALALIATTRLRGDTRYDLPTTKWKVLKFALRLPFCILFWLFEILAPSNPKPQVERPPPVREMPDTTMASRSEKSPMAALQSELNNRKKVGLQAAVKETDQIIALLESAREKVGEAPDQHSVSLVMTRLQNPINRGFEALNRSLADVSKAQKKFGRALDKALPPRTIPTTPNSLDGMESHVTKAIIMHLFREGQLDVASAFLKEAWDQSIISPDDTFNKIFEPLESSFTELNGILAQIRDHRNLLPAIAWAEAHAEGLKANASDLQFKLFKLQFIWLVKGPSVNGLPDNEHNGPTGALQYAQRSADRFKSQHERELGRLVTSVIYLANIEGSPYKALYEMDRAFDDVASAFAREFCCLLNLSADSPLYLAVTAGAIAFPRRLKHMQLNLTQRTEWTSPDEQPFETPLPPRMVFHPIFVCPVAKEQTTTENPPMILPCGHVVSKEALKKILKGSRFKCPYCPNEGLFKDAKEIKF